MSNICSNCNAENVNEAKFCKNCGQELTLNEQESSHNKDTEKYQSDTKALSFSEFFFSANGRISRMEFVSRGFLPLTIILILIITIQQTLNSQILLGNINISTDFINIIAILLSLVISYMSAIVSIKRFHDFNYNGWTYLWMFLPLINFIVLLILMFKNKVDLDNRFGKTNHYEMSKVKWWMFVFKVILLFITLMALSMSELALDYSLRNPSMKSTDSKVMNEYKQNSEYVINKNQDLKKKSRQIGAQVESFRWEKGVRYPDFLETHQLPRKTLLDKLDVDDRRLVEEIRAGVHCTYLKDSKGEIEQVLIPLNDELQIHIYKVNNSYKFEAIPIIAETKTGAFTLKIQSNPAVDIKNETGSINLVSIFLTAFGSSLDFTTLRKGNDLVMIYEQKYRLGKPFSMPILKAAMIKTYNKSYYTYLNEDGRYYDEKGESTEDYARKNGRAINPDKRIRMKTKKLKSKEKEAFLILAKSYNETLEIHLKNNTQYIKQKEISSYCYFN